MFPSSPPFFFLHPPSFSFLPPPLSSHSILLLHLPSLSLHPPPLPTLLIPLPRLPSPSLLLLHHPPHLSPSFLLLPSPFSSFPLPSLSSLSLLFLPSTLLLSLPPLKADRAANFIRSAVRFRASLLDNKLEPEIYHLNPQRSDTQRFRNIIRCLCE